MVQAWRGRKRQACGHHLHSSIQGEWLAIDDQKNNILASLCLASYLTANWLETGVCVVSQFDLSITKQNCLFVRCQSLSHIRNNSLRCSIWKLKLMTGVKTAKQQTGEIKNTI